MSKSNPIDQLQSVISSLNLKENQSIDLDRVLAGGVVSIVASGSYHENDRTIPVAIKYTLKDIEQNSVFSPLETRNLLKFAYLTQDIDFQILNNLQNHDEISVPQILGYYKDERVTILENFTPKGFELMQSKLINDPKVELKELFKKIGIKLALLRKEMSQMKGIKSVEDRILQIDERTDELRVSLYDGRMHYLNELWGELLDDDKAELTWTDGHPKNMAINDEGDIIFFDFGRSIYCDPEYPVANFLGQIFLFAIAGTLDIDVTIEAAHNLISEYEKHFTIDEKNLVWYITTELAHRGKTMRWIDSNIVKVPGKDKKEMNTRVKLAVDHVIDTVFDIDNPIVKKNTLFEKILKISQYLKDSPDTYVRPKI